MIELRAMRSLAPVSAASGLVRVDDHWCVIADDALALAAYPVHRPDAPPRLYPLFPGRLPAEPKARKKVKPDLESLAALPACDVAPHGALFALGSGSRPNRMRGVLLLLAAHGCLPATHAPAPPAPAGDARAASATAPAVRPVDLTGLYTRLSAVLGEINIEGAAVWNDRLVLLQRGKNRGSADPGNALVIVSLARALEALAAGTSGTDATIGADALEDIVPIALGTRDGVPLGFTDASALPDGRLLFVAAAEDTDDAYEDGAVAGSAVGMLAADGRLLWTEPVAGSAKLEGLAAECDGDTIRLALASDADDPDVPSMLYAAAAASAGPPTPAIKVRV